MGKVRRPYPEEFKLQMVELVRAGDVLPNAESLRL